ncbi:MAG: hypothetical protein ACOC2M_01450 [bacterium]
MKIYIFYIVIIILILLDAFLLYKLTSKNNSGLKDNTNAKVEKLIEISRIADELNFVNRDCILIGKDSKEMPLSQLTLSNPLLVLKISKLNCHSCTDQNIELIKTFLQKYKISKKKIAVFYEDSNIRDLKLLNKSLNNKIMVYRIKEKNSLQLQIDKLNIPYFFVLDSSFAPQLIHVTNKSFSDFTNEYLEIVYNNFFDEDRY